MLSDELDDAVQIPDEKIRIHSPSLSSRLYGVETTTTSVHIVLGEDGEGVGAEGDYPVYRHTLLSFGGWFSHTHQPDAAWIRRSLRAR